MATHRIPALLAVILLGLAAFATADLPVHCLNVQIAGRWVFELGDDNNDNTIRCGHKIPDTNLDHFTKEGYNLEVVKKYELELKEPNVVIDSEGNQGTWTMVYDEGFEVLIAGKTYFAFSKYLPKTPASLQRDEVEDYNSICDETLVGWFHNIDGSHWGCYHGKKLDGVTYHVQAAQRDNSLKKVVAPPRFEELRQPATVFPPKADDEDQTFEPDTSFIELHNSVTENTWRAGVNRGLVGRRMGDMAKLLGYTKRGTSSADTRHKRPRPRAIFDNRPDHVKYAGLPLEFDWRNKGGVNFDSPVKNQENCGSCYSMATIAVAEARIRILSNGKDTTLLSSQAVVSCSIYNQGCDGGYPYLVAKHAMDYGLVPEDCMPYSGTNEECDLRRGGSMCPDPVHPVRYMATNYSYIGGYYGACSETAMMRELYEHGPIMVAFDAPSSLFYYTGGIYTGPAPPSEGPSLKNLRHWEKTNHAVVAVGWGQTVQGEKYWIIKNTWGADWGESGYFRIRRGTDECGMESMASTLYMQLPDERSL